MSLNHEAAERNATRDLTRAGIATFAVRAIGATLAFGAHLGLARWMGVHEYGTFIYVYTWTYALALLAKVGFDRAAVRFGPQYIASGAYGDFAALGRMGLRFAWLAGIAATLLLCLIAAFLVDTASLRQCFWIGAGTIPLLAVHHVYLGIAQALKRVWQATLPELIIRHGLLVALVGAWWLIDPTPPTATTATALHLLAVALTVAVDFTWLRLSLPASVRSAPVGRNKAEWRTYSVQMALVSNVVSWTVQVDLLMVGTLAGAATAGAYAVAARIASLVPWISLATMTLFSPMVAELVARNDRSMLQNVTRSVAARVAWTSTALALALGVTSSWLLEWFGADFRTALVPLLILLAGQAAQDWFGPVATVMNLSGLQALTLRVVTAGLAVSVGLHLIWIPWWGATGAALATAITIFGNAALLWWLTRSRLGVNASPYFAGMNARTPLR